MRAIVGPVGVLISKNKQRYLNAPLDFGLEVDYTGHSWVFKTEWLKYLWREYVPSWDAGEDIAFSALAWMHGRVRTVMPKMSTDEYELWGDSIKIFHKDGNESSSYSVPTAIRWPLTRCVTPCFTVVIGYYVCVLGTGYHKALYRACYVVSTIVQTVYVWGTMPARYSLTILHASFLVQQSYVTTYCCVPGHILQYDV